MKKKKYVPNDVFKFRVSLDWDFINQDIVVYTKPFPEYPPEGYKSEEQIEKFWNAQEDLVQEKYFTQERIDELKQKLIQRIQESKNPFAISCADRDGGYNVTEDMLFDLDSN